MKLKVLELFAGIGACSSALDRLGIDHEIVDAVEIDKYAMQSFNQIHGTNFEVQDICTWDKDLKDIDLIMHGSPCQDFSIAGLQAGGDIGSGTRSSLMYETIRIVGKLRPKYVIWENVKNILSAKHKHNFDNYLTAMESLGYKNFYEVLNAKDYGVPQNRERVFTISIRNDIQKEYVFPTKQELHLRLKDVLEDEVEEKYYLGDAGLKYFQRQAEERGENLADYTERRMITVAHGRCKGNNKPLDVSPTLDTQFSNNWRGVITVPRGNTEPKVIVDGFVRYKENSTKHQSNTIYNKNGLSPTLSATEYKNPSKVIEEPKIIKHDIVQQVRVRKYPVDTDKLVQVLRNAKLEKDVTNNMIASELNVPVTKVEHWFRRDECFAIPDEDIWFKLKELLGITTDEFDKAIMTFEVKDGVYDKANRVYEDNGLAPTLTQQEEKVINNYRIRKLTPRECYRLMGFTDEEFDKASQGMSNTQLYKQAGNSIVVNVLKEILNNLFLANEQQETEDNQISFKDFIE